MTILGGLDLGTSGCKLSVYDDGGLIARARAAYPATRSGGRHSLDANAVWRAAKSLFREVIGNNRRVAAMEAVSVSSFGEAGVPLDARGMVLGESALFSDARGGEEAAGIAEKLGDDRIRFLCGVAPHPMYTVCKLANLRRCADYFPRIAYFPLFEDFVIHRLTGERVISYSLASRTMGLDVEARDWAGEVFEAAGIDVRLMSRPVASGTIAGPILPEVAREVGVGGKLLVVTGGHDQMCVAVGSGALDDGIAANGAGTVEALSMTVPSACDKTRLCSASYSYSIHGDPASRFTYAFCPSGSVILNWYVNAFGLGEIGRFADGIRTPPRPGPLLILPYFSGSGTPHLDADATGVFSGMTLETTKEDIYVALLEGLAHDLAVNIGRLGGLGIPVDTIRAAGGGASSPLWLQIKADVTGKPVCALRDAEAGALGCVMLAAAAIGRFRNLREAARAMIAVGETYPPDPARHEQYKERTLQFQELYETSRGFARRI